MSKRLDLSAPKNRDNYRFKKDQTVHVPFLVCGEESTFGPREIMFSAAFDTGANAVYGCFWFKGGWLRQCPDEKPEVRKMTAREFVELRMKDGGMNPFETLAMMETYSKLLATWSKPQEEEA